MYEAGIVIMELAKLQTPNAVAQNSVGKVSAVATYTVRYAAAIPNLAIITYTGIKERVKLPKNTINKEPVIAIENDIWNVRFALKNLYMKPAVMTAMSSEQLDAK